MSEAIFNRRSIRKYKDTPVEQGKLEQLMRAAMAAPTAMNRQGWHFLIIDDKEIKARFSALQPYSKMLSEAPVLILVCYEDTTPYYQQDAAFAAQNIMTLAYELGLGTCCLGMPPERDRQQPFIEAFGLPESIIPVCGIALGYPEEEKGPADRFNPEKVHRNVW